MSPAAVIAAAPCAKCPFRKDVPIYLHRARRAEIARALAGGSTFHCHAMVDYGTEDEQGESQPDVLGASMCAGAAKALLLDGASTNLMRVMSRLGAVDLDRVEERGAEVWPLSDWQRLPEGATADDRGEDDEAEVETCCTVNDGCLAPAGYLGSGGVIAYGTDAADGECSLCGEALCSNCADGQGRCGTCSDGDDE